MPARALMNPIVFVPGMMCDERLFAHQVSSLRASIKGVSVTVAPIIEHDNMPDLARDILQSAAPKFALVGLSMGGIVAMEIMRQAPQRVERVCLMDTNPLAETQQVAANRLPQIEKVRRGKLQQVMRDEMKPNYLSDSGDKDQILDLCMDMALSLGAEVFIKQSLALKNRSDQTNTLQSYDKPALIMHGEDDLLCPAERHELMHSLLPRSRYEIIKNAGHLPTLEQPKQVNEILNAWLLS